MDEITWGRSVAWVRTGGGVGHSAGRLERLASEWRAIGSEVLVGEEGPVATWFEVRLDEAWQTTAVSVSCISHWGSSSLILTRRRGGQWSINHEPAEYLEDCVDVDIAATPLTNTFPVRRYADRDASDGGTIPVAWIETPSLVVRRVDQTYRKLEVVSTTPRVEAWEYRDETFGPFRIEVDEDGLVKTYEGFAKRVGE